MSAQYGADKRKALLRALASNLRQERDEGANKLPGGGADGNLEQHYLQKSKSASSHTTQSADDVGPAPLPFQVAAAVLDATAAAAKAVHGAWEWLAQPKGHIHTLRLPTQAAAERQRRVAPWHACADELHAHAQRMLQALPELTNAAEQHYGYIMLLLQQAFIQEEDEENETESDGGMHRSSSNSDEPAQHHNRQQEAAWQQTQLLFPPSTAAMQHIDKALCYLECLRRAHTDCHSAASTASSKARELRCLRLTMDRACGETLDEARWALSRAAGHMQACVAAYATLSSALALAITAVLPGIGSISASASRAASTTNLQPLEQQQQQLELQPGQSDDPLHQLRDQLRALSERGAQLRAACSEAAVQAAQYSASCCMPPTDGTALDAEGMTVISACASLQPASVGLNTTHPVPSPGLTLASARSGSTADPPPATSGLTSPFSAAPGTLALPPIDDVQADQQQASAVMERVLDLVRISFSRKSVDEEQADDAARRAERDVQHGAGAHGSRGPKQHAAAAGDQAPSPWAGTLWHNKILPPPPHLRSQPMMRCGKALGTQR